MRQLGENKAKGKAATRHIADSRQAAILILRRIELRDENRQNPTTRAQFTVPMLRRLWNRPRLSPEFLEDVSAWLAVAGWCFFNAGATYAAVRISAVKNWPRLGTGKMAAELDQVARGNFPFEDHEHLLIAGATEEERMLAEETSDGQQGHDPTSEHDG
jgi:predicted DNA-binding transcriptional regulator AlpA